MPRKKKQEVIAPKVGDHVTAIPETDWVISRVWDQKDCWDIELLRTKDGERGCCRVSKTNPIVRIKHSPRTIETITLTIAYVVFLLSIKLVMSDKTDLILSLASVIVTTWSLRYIIKRVSKEF